MTDNLCINCGYPLHTGITCEHALDKTRIDNLRTTLAAARAERDEAKRDAELAKMRANRAALEARREKAELDEAVALLCELRKNHPPATFTHGVRQMLSGEQTSMLWERADAFLARIGGGE